MLTESQINLILPNWDRIQWYYSVELSPGLYTKGFEFNNIALTRKIIQNIDLNGKQVLDFSTMEGAIATIMTKRGARVMATDAIDVSDRVALIQRAHGVRFDYYPSMPLHRFAERVFEIQASQSFNLTLDEEIGPTDNTNFGFDIVVSSGLLYHVLNPLDHLLTYRKLSKLGGLLVIESAVAISDEVSLLHVIRPGETLYGGNATWFITTATLDLFLRACFFQPLAFCYLGRERWKTIEIARFGIVARAVERRPFEPLRYDELRTSEIFRNQDFQGLRHASLLTGRVSKPMVVAMNDLYPVENGISVAAVNGSTLPLSYTESDLRLSLEVN